MSEQIPITPELLSWARERSGLSREEVKQKFLRFDDWERGVSFPTYSQLERLSEIFKVPIAVFFFPSPPKVPPISETFRTLPTSEIEKLPSRIRLLLRKAKSLQLSLHELTGGRNTAVKLITRDLIFAENISIEEMAAIVRNYIGVSLVDQQSWKDDEVALKEWRAALLRVGVYVFKDAFRLEEFSGFCLYDDVFPIIYVNNSSTKTRQIFTYFHELAHLLFHTSGIDSLHDDYIANLNPTGQQIEILCNRFAAEFLMPSAAFKNASSGLPPSEATAEILAKQFHVSRETVYRRFLNEGRIDQTAYSVAVAVWNSQRQSGGSGGDYYWTKLTYLGRDYVELALRQFHRNSINEEQLADHLDTKPKNIGTLEEYFERGG